MTNIVGRMRTYYLVGLLLISVFGTCFAYLSFLTNKEIDGLTKVAESIMHLDLDLARVVKESNRLKIEPNSAVSKKIIDSILKSKNDYLLRQSDLIDALQQLQTETGKQFSEIKVSGANVFMHKSADNVMRTRIDDLIVIRNALEDPEAKNYKDGFGARRPLNRSEPYNLAAGLVVQPFYLVLQKKSVKQRQFVQAKLRENSAALLTYTYTFIVAGFVGLLLIGLLIFRPMEKLVARQINELNEANIKVQAADRSKSEFLANMSHEIRTPMNGVMGMAELLSKTVLDAKQRMYTDVIVKSGASLLTIINDILDFSKLDAGQMELEAEPFKIREAVEDVATLVSSKVAEKDLELIVRVNPDIPDAFVGDVGRIRQIITNLMGNAVKFTETGHVYVNVDGVINDDADQPTARLRIEVQDTGIGIPADKVSQVFEKFSQVDGSATRKHEGTGLGLSISSSLVSLMDGKIGVESVEDSGSTFWFEIELPIHSQFEKTKRVPFDVSRSRILVVDDNPVNRSILQEQMSSWNFDCSVASSGEQALSKIEEDIKNGKKIDCVVMDYHMPEMNGGEAVKAMHKNPQTADIAVIMLTSVDETEDGKSFSSLGVQGHLTKPTRSSMLLETLVGVLQDQKVDSDRHQVVANAKKMAEYDASSGVMNPVSENAVPRKFAEQENSDRSFETIMSKSEQIEVLVCEDNEVNQIVFRQILEQEGLRYKIANNGREGLSYYYQLEPQIILMDVSMPEMNGLEATQKIREQEAETRIHIPIIGVTAHALKGDMERCLDAGMDDYLSKPITPDALIAKLHKWLKRDVSKAV